MWIQGIRKLRYHLIPPKAIIPANPRGPNRPLGAGREPGPLKALTISLQAEGAGKGSVRELAAVGFVIGGIDHFDSIPGAAIQEGAFRSLGSALTATDAFEWIHLYDSKAGGARVLHEDHAFIDRAIGLAYGRTGAAGAGFNNISQYLGLFFTPFR